jgi:hypothetical protein
MSRKSIVRAFKPSEFGIVSSLEVAFSVLGGSFAGRRTSAEERLQIRAANDAAHR